MEPLEPGALTEIESPPHSLFADRDDLEPYRRLLETQKQVVNLVKQCEQSKLECALLRERLAREGIIPGGPRPRLATRVGKFAARQARKICYVAARAFRAMETGVTIRYK
jgi:hypothetical protein